MWIFVAHVTSMKKLILDGRNLKQRENYLSLLSKILLLYFIFFRVYHVTNNFYNTVTSLNTYLIFLQLK